MEQKRTIIWRRLDTSGHEFAVAFSEQGLCGLNGTAILVYEKQFCRLEYRIQCDPKWQTLSAKIDGLVGEKRVGIEMSVDAEKRWKLNKSEIASVKGCIDVDLNFSPATNTLPIRRLNLAVGEKAAVRAAWLTFPNFSLEPLAQTYERVSENKYLYESAGGQFTAEIEVDDFGFVTHYENLWEIENIKQ